jgi:hypothetical protein
MDDVYSMSDLVCITFCVDIRRNAYCMFFFISSLPSPYIVHPSILSHHTHLQPQRIGRRARLRLVPPTSTTTRRQPQRIPLRRRTTPLRARHIFHRVSVLAHHVAPGAGRVCDAVGMSVSVYPFLPGRTNNWKEEDWDDIGDWVGRMSV